MSEVDQWHCCPWCNNPLPAVKHEASKLRREKTGDESEFITFCQRHGSMSHEDNAKDFCWCEK